MEQLPWVFQSVAVLLKKWTIMTVIDLARSSEILTFHPNVSKDPNYGSEEVVVYVR